jgi:hypothetical protein
MSLIDNGYHNRYRRIKVSRNEGVGPCISASARELPNRMSVKQDKPASLCLANSKQSSD